MSWCSHGFWPRLRWVLACVMVSHRFRFRITSSARDFVFVDARPAICLGASAYLKVRREWSTVDAAGADSDGAAVQRHGERRRIGRRDRDELLTVSPWRAGHAR